MSKGVKMNHEFWITITALFCISGLTIYFNHVIKRLGQRCSGLHKRVIKYRSLYWEHKRMTSKLIDALNRSNN